MADKEELEKIPNFLMTLKERSQKMSRQHRRIADFLIHQHLMAAFLNVAELAKQAGVSSATVIRFATSLGFSGYPALQKELQSIAKGSIGGRHEYLSVESTEKSDALSGTIAQSINALNILSQEIDKEAFQKASRLLFEARKVVTVGHKASFGVAVHSAYVLGKVHKNVQYLSGTDNFSSFSDISDLSELDVALVFAVIHYPRTTLKLIRLLARRGVKIIIVSDYRTFKEIELASVSILAPLLFQGFLDIMSPMMAIADAFAYQIYKIDEIKTKERLKLFNEFNEQDEAFLNVSRFAK